MGDLFIHGRKVKSIFQLLGTKEDDMSYSLGYALSESKSFLEALLERLNISCEIDQVKIRLQEYEKGKGFTDFEIIQEEDFHIIIEAKRGWVFPQKDQLLKYESRPSFRTSKAREKRMVVLNESNEAYCQANFALPTINSTPVEVVSWKEVTDMAKTIIAKSYSHEKRILKDLIKYLNIVGTMQSVDSNMVYVVSIGSGIPENWSISWLDVVNEKQQYFHSVGGGKGGWPTEPPNYIAFRYSGKLQSIHHIDSYEVFTDPNEHFSEIPSQIWEPHYLYKLGPAIIPAKEIKSGKRIVRSIRVWAMLDLLLTSSTIEEARDLTKERLKE